MTDRFWRIAYSRTNEVTGGATSSWCTVLAPTAADAITMFNVATAKRPTSSFFYGPEGIRLATPEESRDTPRRLSTDLDGLGDSENRGHSR